MSSDITYRRYKPGDEGGIVSTMNACFDTFRDFGLNKDTWLAYEAIDDGFEKENALVAEHAGKVVGHVQIIRRNVKIGDATFVPMGGIANVSTIPEMRGRGISTTLITHAVDLCRRNGIPLSGLFTGYGSVAHRVYRRVGFGNTILCPNMLVGTGDEIRKVKEVCNEASGPRIRNYESRDENEMANVYRDWCGGFTGVTKSSAVYWKRKMVDVSSSDTFFYEEFDPKEVLVALEDGEITAYAYITLWKTKQQPFKPADVASVREIVFRPGHMALLMKLVDAVMDTLISEDIKVCEVFAPDDQTYPLIFKSFKKIVRDQGVYMVHIPLMEKLLQQLRRDLENRLDKTPAIASNMTLLFDTPYGDTTLGVQGGEVKVVETEPSATIFFDEDTFTRMLFGIETLSELMRGDAVRIHTSEPIGKVTSVIESLFPKRTWFTCPIDHW